MLKELSSLAPLKNTEGNNRNKTGYVLDAISLSNEYIQMTMQVKLKASQ